MESVGYYSVSYIDDIEVTEEDCAAYDAGEYDTYETKIVLSILRLILDHPSAA